MPGIGWQGLLILAVILLVFFGAKRLPEMGRGVGQGMREFKDSISGRDDEPEEIETLVTTSERDRVAR